MKGQVYWVTVHLTSVTTHFKYQFELHVHEKFLFLLFQPFEQVK